MKYTYEANDELDIIIRKDDNNIISSIPKDLGNSDYQRYLRWLENPDADESGTL